MDLTSEDSANGGAQTMPVKDFGSFVYNSNNVSDAEIKDHRSVDTDYVSLHLPRNRHRHRRGRPKQGRSKPHAAAGQGLPEATHPSQHVQFLLGEDERDDHHKTHDLFCELGELFYNNGEGEWRETARWIKFEEDVEEGGERWSKPHVATLSLHSLFELRSCLHNGAVILDMEVMAFYQVIDIMLDRLVATNQLEETLKDQIRSVMLLRHRRLHEKPDNRDSGSGGKIGSMPIIRSLADIGRKYSLPKDMVKEVDQQKLTSVQTMPNINSLHKGDHSNRPEVEDSSAATPQPGMRRNQSSGTDLKESPTKPNLHFMKKIPVGAEAANVLVGEVDFLNHQIVSFIRLKSSVGFGNLTEVPVPTKFVFVMLGPLGGQSRYHEIGRSIATLLTDEVFREVAYHAHKREDLLAGIDEFLSQVTVLPPGEWDPSIRIEPPKSVPSQSGRKTGESKVQIANGKVTQAAEENHGDPGLQRTGRLFGGVIQDVKRKAPFYVSDFLDGLNAQCLGSFLFLYFACLAPIITFGLLLADATDKDLGAFEGILGGAIVGIVYALLAGQPLGILGTTGPALILDTLLFNFCKDNGWYYLSFRWWVGLWTGVIMITMVAFDLSALVRYITRFTEESFAALISIIFIKESIAKLLVIARSAPVNMNPEISPFHDCICVAPEEPTIRNYTLINRTLLMTTLDTTTVEKHWHKIPKADCVEHGGSLIGEGCEHVADVFFSSCLLFVFTFVIASALKGLKKGRFFPTRVRAIVSDFAVVIAIGVMVAADALTGLETPKLKVPEKFQPTHHENRGWIIPPFHEKNPPWLCIVAILPAMFATILLFMDQMITTVIVNRKENKLKKGSGYHLDLLIVAVLIIVNSMLGLPYFVATTVLSINHVMSLRKESSCTAPGERPIFLGVREQRITGACMSVMIGLSVFITPVLNRIPMAVLYGVFLFMGVSSLKGMELVSRIMIMLMPIKNQPDQDCVYRIPMAVLYGVFLFMGVSSLKGMELVSRIMVMLMPMKNQPDYAFLRHVRMSRVHVFTVIQVACLAILWVIKDVKAISIAFPIMVLAMCFIRKSLDWVFTQHELKWLDDIMPEAKKREKEDKEKEQHHGEQEALLDPKCSAASTSLDPPAIVDIAIAGEDSYIGQMNISQEMTDCSLWKNLQTREPSPDSDSGKRKHKKHHRKEPNLPTIPSSPESDQKTSTRDGAAVFFINDDSDKDVDSPGIMMTPPSFNTVVESSDKVVAPRDDVNDNKA